MYKYAGFLSGVRNFIGRHPNVFTPLKNGLSAAKTTALNAGENTARGIYNFAKNTINTTGELTLPHKLYRNARDATKHVWNNINYYKNNARNYKWHEHILGQNTLKNMRDSAKAAKQGIKDFKPLETHSGLPGTILGTAFPAWMGYEDLTSQDYDQAGTFESALGKGSMLANDLAFFAPSFAEKGLLPVMAASMIARPLLKKITGFAGRKLDSLAGTQSTPESQYRLLQSRIGALSNNIKRQYPNATPAQIQREALRQFNMTHPDYDWSYLQGNR